MSDELRVYRQNWPGRDWRRACLAGIALTLAFPLLLLLVSVAGCRAPPTPRPEAVTPVGAAGAALFRLDAEASQIWLYLHADGPLSRVGHDHVITTHGLQGSVWLHPQLERSSCEFQLPVATLVVDDAQERAAAGDEFSEPLDAEARAGTREHMLGDSQLAAARYPLVTLRCRRLTPTAAGVTVELTVTLRDRASQLAVPASWQRAGNTLQASGEFSFRQTALGLEPYSLLFGALRVADEIRARFLLVARHD